MCGTDGAPKAMQGRGGHVEVEQKSYCAREQLERAERWLDGAHPGAEKVEQVQTDVYLDCRLGGDPVLFAAGCSFRRREKRGGYVFTVKAPAGDRGGPALFARHEHELARPSPEVDAAVWQFLLDALAACGRRALGGMLDRGRLEPLLVVEDRRTTYRLEGRCEICLDRVDYRTAAREPLGERDHQLEVELLDGPADWGRVEEEVLRPLLRAMGAVRRADCSKLERGMSLLRGGGPR